MISAAASVREGSPEGARIQNSDLSAPKRFAAGVLMSMAAAAPPRTMRRPCAFRMFRATFCWMRLQVRTAPAVMSPSQTVMLGMMILVVGLG